MYSHMMGRVNSSREQLAAYRGLPILSREEFYAWIAEREDTFSALYQAWVESGFKALLAPSVDRIDPYEGYVPENMRLVTFRENQQGTRRQSRRGHSPSGFKGVKKRKTRFEATLKLGGKIMYLGSAKTLEGAARLYDAKAYELHGERAVLNFPVRSSLN